MVKAGSTGLCPGTITAFVLRRSMLGVPFGLAVGGCLATRGATVPAGQVAPAFSLVSHDGRTVTLDSLLTRGPAVLVFYRGYW